MVYCTYIVQMLSNLREGGGWGEGRRLFSGRELTQTKMETKQLQHSSQVPPHCSMGWVYVDINDTTKKLSGKTMNQRFLSNTEQKTIRWIIRGHWISSDIAAITRALENLRQTQRQSAFSAELPGQLGTFNNSKVSSEHIKLCSKVHTYSINITQ